MAQATINEFNRPCCKHGLTIGWCGICYERNDAVDLDTPKRKSKPAEKPPKRGRLK